MLKRNGKYSRDREVSPRRERVYGGKDFATKVGFESRVKELRMMTAVNLRREIATNECMRDRDTVGQKHGFNSTNCYDYQIDSISSPHN